MLLALRAKAKESDIGRKPTERAAMRGVAFVARHPKLFALSGRLMRTFARLLVKEGRIKSAPLSPLSDWTDYRDLPAPQGPSFRERWKKNELK
jgi:L-lactate dehydrogenase complex protein LldF